MKKLLLICVLISATVALCNTQPDALWSELKIYHITPDVLTMAYNEDWDGVSFTRTNTSSSESSDFRLTEIAAYDAAKSVGQRWRLVSVNDKTPENYYIKDFNKQYNSTKKREAVVVNQSSLSKAGEEGANVIYTFTYSQAPSDYTYLKDCTAKLYVNKLEGTIEKLEMTNNGPTKMGGLKVSAVKIHITYGKQGEMWVVRESELMLTGKFLGAQATNKTVKKYTIQK